MACVNFSVGEIDVYNHIVPTVILPSITFTSIYSKKYLFSISDQYFEE